MNYICNFLKVRKYFVKSFFQVELVEHQNPQLQTGLAQCWAEVSVGGGLAGVLRPFLNPNSLHLPPLLSTFSLDRVPLTRVFSSWPLGRTAGQTGHLAVPVSLAVKGNSCLGLDMMGRGDRIFEKRGLGKEVEEGKESLGPKGEAPGQRVSFQLCYKIWCLPETEDAVGGKQEGMGWGGSALGDTVPHWLQTGAWQEKG